MFRLYLGRLDREVTEERLGNLFSEHGLSCSNILVKRGYAFVDCPDQETLELAVKELNGTELMGSVMQVEPSNSKRRRSNKISIKNVPTLVTKDDLERLVSAFGAIERCDFVPGEMENCVNVTYESPEQAQQAVEELNDYQYQGASLKVEFVQNGRMQNGRQRRPGNGNNRANDYPLRINVPSDMVGAIIGRGGQTIGKITKQSRARVDVHRKENTGSKEKGISIYGNPENCSNACKEIIKVIQEEIVKQQNLIEPPKEVELKMLGEDPYCGRLIGKDGKHINAVRKETDTKVAVSNYQDLTSSFPDRQIIIRGELDNVIQAEAKISEKLRDCFSNDLQAQGFFAMQPRGMFQPAPGVSPLAMMGGSVYGMRGGQYGLMGRGFYPQMAQQQHRQQQQQQLPQGQDQVPHGQVTPPVQPRPEPDTRVEVIIPGTSAGALIGTGGSNIKQIIRDSNAHVTIDPKKDDDPTGDRTVTIRGTPEAQWRASYFVHDKLRTEGFAGMEDVRLKTKILVPKDKVGYVIGKRGRNVRDVQRMTGAMVRLPEIETPDGEGGESTPPVDDGSNDAVVELFGNFQATQHAIGRVRALAMRQPGGPGMGPGPMMGNPRRPGVPPQARNGGGIKSSQ
ncbi:unnamed protein product [Owenia fusiformis]|uniref:RRM domain-containing protein n=1 Tax=Owenia fusiformis TaxID=6347 RepID=A0A8S4P865_OWEFU|nr:unnamed protein product [Owenia fusiformis]